ncbi:MAG: insulinase family protein [Bacteroidales bacterium]|nr:insulinase family protein [Bacteroidales bacterium]
MKYIYKFTALIIALIIGSATGFGQINNLSLPLPSDNNYKIGKLENGLTYYIRPAKNPAGRAEFFIVHNVGSLQENDDQRGLAHFLEHMAFNGTKNFPGKLLLEYFGSIGVKFGANINAYTSMERTVYNISAVPLHRGTIIDSALLALHDWSHYISCEPKEIEAERGVVREEWRRGDDARTRMMKGINRFEQTGSRFAQRDVIGLMSVIDNFSRQTLLDYYHKWYRPDLQAVIVIGDVDVDDIEKRIKERFSSIPKVENGAVRESYTVPVNKRPIVGFHTDPESRALSVRMTIKHPHKPVEVRGSYESLYDELLKNIFIDMFKVRCQAAVEGSDSLTRALIPVFGNISYASGTFTTTSLPLNGEKIFDALKAILIEVERVTQHSFDQEELTPSIIRVKKQWETNYTRIKNPKNSDYVSSAIEHFTRGYPLLDIDSYFKLAQDLLDKITLDDINRALPQIVTEENRVIIFAVPESDSTHLPTEDDVLTLMDEIKNSSLDKFILSTDKELSITDKPKEGAIVKRRVITSKDLNIKYDKQLDSATEWVLENGARVIWKESFGDDKSVRMKAFRPGGYAKNESIEEIKLLEGFLTNFTVNGMNKSELTKWSLKKGVSVKPNISYRSNDFTGSFTTKEAESFFGLLYTLFTDVTVNERDINNYKARLLKELNSPKGEKYKFEDTVSKMRFARNLTKAVYDQEFINSVNADKLLSLYDSHIKSPAGYTFVFTGPMKASDAEVFVKKYIASVPAKRVKVSEKFTYREPVLRDGEDVIRYKAKNMLSSKAQVTRTYHGKSLYSAENSMKAKFISYILRDRYMKSIREERGGTYYVSVSEAMFKYPNPLCRFTIEFDTDPALVDDLLEVVQEDIDNLVKYGPTEREMREITLYLSKVYEDREYTTPWLSIICNSIQGEEDHRLSEKSLLGKMNREDIQKFAKQIFCAGNRKTAVFEPEN